MVGSKCRDFKNREVSNVNATNIPVCLAMGGQQGNWRSQHFVCYCNTSSGDAVTLRVGVYIPRGWIRRYDATSLPIGRMGGTRFLLAHCDRPCRDWLAVVPHGDPASYWSAGSAVL